MGQAQGGNSGNLELLKKIKEQQTEIEQLKAQMENRDSGYLYDFAEGSVHVRSIYKRGNVCEISLHMSELNMTGINGVYCNVPEGFRPVNDRTINCSLVFNGTVIAARATIKADGRVIQSYGTGTVTSIMLYGTYLI